MPGTTVEVELYYRNSAHKTSVTLEWIGSKTNIPFFSDHTLANFTNGDLFAAQKTTASFSFIKGAVTTIYIWTKDVNFEEKRKSELLTDVTVRYPGLENVIRTHKKVMNFSHYSNSPNAIKNLEIDQSEQTSKLFE